MGDEIFVTFLREHGLNNWVVFRWIEVEREKEGWKFSENKSYCKSQDFLFPGNIGMLITLISDGDDSTKDRTLASSDIAWVDATAL